MLEIEVVAYLSVCLGVCLFQSGLFSSIASMHSVRRRGRGECRN